jgi:hypothetical protein
LRDNGGMALGMGEEFATWMKASMKESGKMVFAMGMVKRNLLHNALSIKNGCVDNSYSNLKTFVNAFFDPPIYSLFSVFFSFYACM